LNQEFLCFVVVAVVVVMVTWLCRSLHLMFANGTVDHGYGYGEDQDWNPFRIVKGILFVV
jgi:hypothetical protein